MTKKLFSKFEKLNKETIDTTKKDIREKGRKEKN